MFDPTSRYYEVETVTLTVKEPNGTSREIAYKRRRFIPPAENLTTVVEHTFAQGERLDLITASYLDDPAQFWRICDVNNVMNPSELEKVGRTIQIAVPTQ